MARLWTCGFDVNSTTTGVEGYTVTGTIVNTATNARTGRSLEINSLVSATGKGINYQFMFSTLTSLFIRFYLYITTLPTADNTIMMSSGSGTLQQTTQPSIKLSSTGTLKLFSGGSQVGSASSALSTGQWYRVEMNNSAVAASGSRTLEAKLEGTTFATTATGTQASGAFLTLCGNGAGEVQTQGDWQFDDVAVNDNTTSDQNTYPGSAKEALVYPAGTGDANTFLIAVGGTAGAANNFGRVNENPPDDITSYNAQAPASSSFTDLFTVGSSGIGASDTINLVSVGFRHSNNIASANAQVAAVIIKASGGTKLTSATVTPNSTTWRTNSAAAPFNYPITAYRDPDNTNWTSTTIGTAQIGYVATGTSASTIRITNTLMYVDYTPFVAPPANLGGTLLALGVG